MSMLLDDRAFWAQVVHLVGELAKGKHSVVQWLTEHWDLIKILMSVPNIGKIDRVHLRVYLMKQVTTIYRSVMIIRLGAYTSGRELRQAVVMAGCGIEGLSDERIDGIKIAPTSKHVGLYSSPVSQLGLERAGLTWDKVLSRLQELGFCPCPEEAALQLMLQLPSLSPHPHCFRVVTDPLRDQDGRTVAYSVVFSQSRSADKRPTLFLEPFYTEAPWCYWWDSTLVFCRTEELAKV